jgi:hypothetical protein
MRLAASTVALVAVLAASPAWAGATAKHSGRIITADPAHQTLTVEEMGPWHGSEVKALRREVVRLTPQTRIDLERRSEQAAGWPGGFAEQKLGAADLKPGDFVTATMERQAGRTIATKVTVVRPERSQEAVPQAR